MSVRFRPPWPGDKVNRDPEWLDANPYPAKACRLCGRPGLPDRRFSWHPRCGAISGAATFLSQGLQWTLRRQRGLCAICGRELAHPKPSGLRYGDYWQVTTAAELDHVVPLWRVALMPPERQSVRWWLPGNLQALCRRCHAVKTAREAGERGRLVAAHRHAARMLGHLVGLA